MMPTAHTRSSVVQVLGSKEIARALKGAPDKIKKAAYKEMLATGFEIHRSAAGMAPVDTGFLRANIAVFINRATGAVAVASGMTSQADELQGFSHAGGGPLDVEYAAKVHDTHRTKPAYLAKASAGAEAGHFRRMKAALGDELKKVKT